MKRVEYLEGVVDKLEAENQRLQEQLEDKEEEWVKKFYEDRECYMDHSRYFEEENKQLKAQIAQLQEEKKELRENLEAWQESVGDLQKEYDKIHSEKEQMKPNKDYAAFIRVCPVDYCFICKSHQPKVYELVANSNCIIQVCLNCLIKNIPEINQMKNCQNCKNHHEKWDICNLVDKLEGNFPEHYFGTEVCNWQLKEAGT
jgi:hypothetical protein